MSFTRNRFGQLNLNFHNYQREAIDFVMGREGSAVFADPGLGKTAIALMCVVVYRLVTGRRSLVVTPLRPMFSTWPKEIEQWSDFAHLEYQICHGKNKTIDPDVNLYLVNPEGLQSFIEQRAARSIGFLIVDESSKFKNFRAVRTKLLKTYAKRVEKRLIMTGTPAPNGYLDLWSQFHIVDGGKALGTRYTKYRNRYFEADDYNQWNWTLRPLARDAIEAATAPLCIRLDGEKLLELPNFVYRNFYCDLPAKHRESYRRIEKKLFAQLGTGKDRLAIVQKKDSPYLKCRQIANGFLYRRTLRAPDGHIVTEGAPGWLELEAAEIKAAQVEERKPNYGDRVTVPVHRAKLDLLREIVEELGGKPVAVVYNFDHEREQIAAEFKTDWVMGDGASAKRGQEIVESWNDDKIDVLLLHPASASHGLNLQHGSGRHIIWYSLTDDLEAYLQLNRRIRRQGVKGRVFIYHLITRGTVDEAIAERLGDKEDRQLSLLDALEEYRNANIS